MPAAPANPSNLSADVRRAFAQARLCYRQGRRYRLGDLVESLGRSGAATVALVLAMPFVWPLSLGPVTTPASLIIILIGWHLMRGREGFPIPARYLAVPLPHWVFRIMRRLFVLLSRVFKWHRIDAEPAETDPTLSFRRLCAVGIVVAGILLLVPIPLLPLTNTFPALGVIAFSMGYIRLRKRDFSVGVTMSCLGALVFVALGAAAASIGLEGIAQIRSNIFGQ